jgi:hypothetical protein
MFSMASPVAVMQRQIGPLPLWAWLLGVAGGIVGARILVRRGEAEVSEFGTLEPVLFPQADPNGFPANGAPDGSDADRTGLRPEIFPYPSGGAIVIGPNGEPIVIPPVSVYDPPENTIPYFADPPPESATITAEPVSFVPIPQAPPPSPPLPQPPPPPPSPAPAVPPYIPSVTLPLPPAAYDPPQTIWVAPPSGPPVEVPYGENIPAGSIGYY